MGQVCGKIHNHKREWISLEEQERRFSIHKLADVYLGLGSEHIRHELFDHQIAHLIKDYAMMDDNWYRACRLMGQEWVPAFPEEHMSEIGDPNSVFYLTPAGSLNEFQTKIRHCVIGVLGFSHLPRFLTFRYNLYDLSDYGDEIRNTPHDAKWALMKRGLLFGSDGKDYWELKEIAKEQEITFPSLQTVAKTLLLDNMLQLEDALPEDNEIRLAIQAEELEEVVKSIERPLFPRPCTVTRVKQSARWMIHLVVGYFFQNSVFISNIRDEIVIDGWGLAVLREF